MKRQQTAVPAYDDLLIPTLEALTALGGSGTIDEIYQTVIEQLKLPDDILEVQHTDTGQTEVEYRLAWSRTYLKKFGLLQNSSRGVWTLTKPIDPKSVRPKDVVQFVRELDRSPKANSGEDAQDARGTEEDAPDDWTAKMHKRLLALSPAAFERLVKRLLRESGFIQVEVTGQSGDGGIDGIGIARLSGFLSFHVLFQCKRYQGAVTPSQIRDFRGAMQGRTDKGLFITTGTFTREAVKEGTRDGAPPIDLIDGEQLIQRLKELGLGVRIKMVESIEIDEDWFASL